MRPTGGRNCQLIHPHFLTCYNGSTVVENSTHNPTIEGSNPGINISGLCFVIDAGNPYRRGRISTVDLLVLTRFSVAFDNNIHMKNTYCLFQVKFITDYTNVQ